MSSSFSLDRRSFIAALAAGSLPKWNLTADDVPSPQAELGISLREVRAGEQTFGAASFRLVRRGELDTPLGFNPKIFQSPDARVFSPEPGRITVFVKGGTINYEFNRAMNWFKDIPSTRETVIEQEALSTSPQDFVDGQFLHEIGGGEYVVVVNGKKVVGAFAPSYKNRPNTVEIAECPRNLAPQEWSPIRAEIHIGKGGSPAIALILSAAIPGDGKEPFNPTVALFDFRIGNPTPLSEAIALSEDKGPPISISVDPNSDGKFFLVTYAGGFVEVREMPKSIALGHPEVEFGKVRDQFTIGLQPEGARDPDTLPKLQHMKWTKFGQRTVGIATIDDSERDGNIVICKREKVLARVNCEDILGGPGNACFVQWKEQEGPMQVNRGGVVVFSARSEGRKGPVVLEMVK